MSRQRAKEKGCNLRSPRRTGHVGAPAGIEEVPVSEFRQFHRVRRRNFSQGSTLKFLKRIGALFPASGISANSGRKSLLQTPVSFVSCLLVPFVWEGGLQAASSLK